MNNILILVYCNYHVVDMFICITIMCGRDSILHSRVASSVLKNPWSVSGLRFCYILWMGM